MSDPSHIRTNTARSAARERDFSIWNIRAGFLRLIYPPDIIELHTAEFGTCLELVASRGLLVGSLRALRRWLLRELPPLP
ncbi:MAG: hypothetical protein MI919_28675 [Holophagales bacterium]|nr:hypothetical protein [Holophagales bacterium]